VNTLDHPLATGIAPAWAAEWGEDRFGIFAVLRIGEAHQKLRFIPPGSFRMGSPESEKGRQAWEQPQRLVTLAESYWLADTPCTQELWQEVMGANPSRFKSPRRPVEQVNWDDVQEFLRRLEERWPGAGASLPTETQWEYACRAGTTTSTFAGELEILGSNNGPLLDAIAWYGGNSGFGFDLENGYDSSDWPEKQHSHERAGTRIVGLKRPNAWRLFDMLGNVWEWCADPSREDSEIAVEPDAMGSNRVIRGGSWFNLARLVRAASRSWSAPGARGDDLGFRFSLGRPRSG
jgi:sulfatase modifying factor 1